MYIAFTLNKKNMKSKSQTSYEKESLSPKTAIIFIAAAIILAILSDSITNLF
jgi:hypothetical protein